MAQDMNAQVKGYLHLCQSLARKIAGTRQAIGAGAEYDDLVQEGLINVWQTLGRGVTPSAEIIEHRMRDYIKWLRRRRPVSYEEILPLDDFRREPDFDHVEAAGD